MDNLNKLCWLTLLLVSYTGIVFITVKQSCFKLGLLVQKLLYVGCSILVVKLCGNVTTSITIGIKQCFTSFLLNSPDSVFSNVQNLKNLVGKFALNFFAEKGKVYALFHRWTSFV